MAEPVFNDKWAQSWGKEISNSEDYRHQAAEWQWPITFVMRPSSQNEIPGNRSVFLDLYHGECREAREASERDVAEAPFLIAADVPTWKQIFTREVDPLMALMQGKLRLERGSMGTLAQYVGAAKELVNCAARIETLFPD